MFRKERRLALPRHAVIRRTAFDAVVEYAAWIARQRHAVKDYFPSAEEFDLAMKQITSKRNPRR
jgi:hypothetical protein